MKVKCQNGSKLKRVHEVAELKLKCHPEESTKQQLLLFYWRVQMHAENIAAFSPLHCKNVSDQLKISKIMQLKKQNITQQDKKEHEFNQLE